MAGAGGRGHYANGLFVIILCDVHHDAVMDAPIDWFAPGFVSSPGRWIPDKAAPFRYDGAGLSPQDVAFFDFSLYRFTALPFYKVLSMAEWRTCKMTTLSCLAMNKTR